MCRLLVSTHGGAEKFIDLFPSDNLLLDVELADEEGVVEGDFFQVVVAS
jgi:hypothetical protein